MAPDDVNEDDNVSGLIDDEDMEPDDIDVHARMRHSDSEDDMTVACANTVFYETFNKSFVVKHI